MKVDKVTYAQYKKLEPFLLEDDVKEILDMIMQTLDPEASIADFCNAKDITKEMLDEHQ